MAQAKTEKQKRKQRQTDRQTTTKGELGLYDSDDGNVRMRKDDDVGR